MSKGGSLGLKCAMRLLVAVKRVIDYNARVRVKPDKVRL